MPSFMPNVRALGSPLLSQVPTTSDLKSTTLVVPKAIAATVVILVLSALAGYGVCWLFPTDAKLAQSFGFGAGV